MVSDLDIYRSATVLVERYGAGAEAKAKARVESWTRQGAPEGAAVWQRVLAAVEELQRTERPGGTSSH
jgi:hypothetical protein